MNGEMLFKKMIKKNFAFFDTTNLVDGDLRLVLVEKRPAKPGKDYFPCYVFEMRDTNAGEKMGTINLRVGNNANTKYGGHIGYGVIEKYQGNHYVARSCRLLFPLAKKHGINPVWITCNPENIASRRTCELAGGELVEILVLPENTEQYKLGNRKKCRYRFDL